MGSLPAIETSPILLKSIGKQSSKPSELFLLLMYLQFKSASLKIRESEIKLGTEEHAPYSSIFFIYRESVEQVVITLTLVTSE